jgi:hypothetical protein
VQLEQASELIGVGESNVGELAQIFDFWTPTWARGVETRSFWIMMDIGQRTQPTVRHVVIGWSGHVYHVRRPAGTYPPVGWILADRVNGSIMDPAFMETSQKVKLGARCEPTWRLSDSSSFHSENIENEYIDGESS